MAWGHGGHGSKCGLWERASEPSSSEPDSAATVSRCPDGKGHLPMVLGSGNNKFHRDGNRKELPGLAEGLGGVRGRAHHSPHTPRELAAAPNRSPLCCTAPLGLGCPQRCSFHSGLSSVP